MAAEVAHILKKKVCILALEKHLEKKVTVIEAGGLEVHGILKGFDNNLGLLLSEAELMEPNPNVADGQRPYRKIGTVVIRGRAVEAVLSSAQLTSNPFT